MGRSGLIGAFWCIWVWYDCIRVCLDLVFVVLAVCGFPVCVVWCCILFAPLDLVWLLQ